MEGLITYRSSVAHPDTPKIIKPLRPASTHRPTHPHDLETTAALRKPQDYFHRIWATAFRATDLADAADGEDSETKGEACA